MKGSGLRYRLKNTVSGKYLALGGGYSGKRNARVFTLKEAHLIAGDGEKNLSIEPLSSQPYIHSS